MEQVAVFVDAGYLFAQGSAAIAGSQKPRAGLVLSATEVIAALKRVASDKAPNARILRIYWYDGAAGGSRPTADQALLANLDDVKLRLGFINNSGQQKGVDSLIVTDLIELARQKSISDAVLLSGDEDVRIGVQIAQNYGVRVHLLGIEPSRGSQSHQLLQEADTTSEWASKDINMFLAMRANSVERSPLLSPATGVKTPHGDTQEKLENASELLAIAVSEFVATLEETDLDGVAAYWQTNRGIPSDFDRKLLPCGRSALGRNLDKNEVREVRTVFQAKVKARLASR